MTLSVGFDRRLERVLVLRFICELSTPWATCRGEVRVSEVVSEGNASELESEGEICG